MHEWMGSWIGGGKKGTEWGETQKCDEVYFGADLNVCLEIVLLCYCDQPSGEFEKGATAASRKTSAATRTCRTYPEKGVSNETNNTSL